MTERVTSSLLLKTLNNLLEETKANREEFADIIDLRTKSLKEAETRTLNLQGHLTQRMDALEQGYHRLLDAEKMEPLTALKELAKRVYELENAWIALDKKNKSLEAKNKTMESELEAIKSLIYKKVTT